MYTDRLVWTSIAMTNNITFVIHPETEAASLDLFLKSVTDVSRLIKEVDFVLTRERPKRKWVITELHTSAPTVTISPLVDGRTLEVVAGGLRLLTEENISEPPPHFTTDALKDVKKMGRLFRGRDRARALSFHVNGSKVATVDKRIGEKVDRILKTTFDTLGSLEGTLEAINLHGRHLANFTIWERLSGHPIRCEFHKERWAEEVKSLLERRILVSGRIRYFANGKPALVRDIDHIEDRTASTSANESDFGAIPDLTSDLGVDEYLTKVRNR